MGTDIYLCAECPRGERWESVGELDDYEDRNYEFFAILANVSNPIRSTIPYESISAGRGFPHDLSEETKRNSLLMSGHDPGWAMFRELLTFDWDGKKMRRTAIVDPSIAHAFVNERFDRFQLAAPIRPPNDGRQILLPYCLANDGTGTRVYWTDTYRDAVGSEFLDRLFDVLHRIGPPDDVRIVFSFDS